MKELVTAPNVAKVENLVWPYEEIKEAIENRLKGYVGLEVTEQNLKDMKQSLNDVKQYRITITKFAQEQKRELKKPYDKFTAEVKDVLQAVDMVETPLKQQIDVYENKDKEAREQAYKAMVRDNAKIIGLRDEYVALFEFDTSWLNKTAKKKDVEGAINSQLNQLKDKQNNDDDYKKIMRERREMLSMYIDMLEMNYGLETTIDKENMLAAVDGDTLDVAKEKIKERFETTLAIEITAKEAYKAQLDEHKEPDIEIEPTDLSGDVLDGGAVTIHMQNVTK